MASTRLPGQWLRALPLALGFTATLGNAQSTSHDWLVLGNTQFQSRRFADAKTSFEKAIELDKLSPDAYRALGLAALELKDYDGAYHAWLRASELNPRDEKVLYYLGRLFYEADLPNEAAAWLRKALEISPDDFAATTYLGLSAEALGYDDTALGLYRNAVYLSNSQARPYSWAYLSLAKLLSKHGDAEGAIRALQEARRKCPEAHALTTLGELLASHNQSQEAETVLRRALDLDPGISQAHYRLALLLRSQGKQDEARSEMEKFQAAKAEESKAARVIALRR